MAITTTFLDDLWRVRIALSGLVDVDAVKIERALLTATEPWETVRGGVALPVVAGATQLDDYEYGDAVLNHYRVTRVLPAPGLQLPGTSGNYASTPDVAALDIVGDIEVQIEATFAVGDPAAYRNLVSKYQATSDQRSWVFRINDLNQLQFAWTTAGTLATLLSLTTTNELTLEDGERIALKVLFDANNGAGGRTARFYTAPGIDGPWTLFETVIGAGTTSIFSGSAAVNIPGTDAGTQFLFEGVAHAAKIISDPFGTAVEVANPDFAAENDGTTSFVDDAGQTWTINGTAQILTGNPLAASTVLQMVNVAGSSASTPDAAAHDITGDIDVRVKVALDDWSSGASQRLASKFTATGDQRSWMFTMAATGALQFQHSVDGATTLFDTSTVVPALVDGQVYWLRATLDVDNGAGGHTVTFYQSDNGVNWTPIGAPVTTAGITSIFNSTASVRIGADGAGTNLPVGDFYEVEIRNGINGTVVADPDFTVQTPGDTSFGDGQGNTWTINPDAEIIVLETFASITPDNNGLTILKSIRYPALNRSIGEFPDFRPPQRSSRTGVYNIKGRVPPVAVHDAWTSPWWTMEFVTDTLAQARDIDLCIAAGGTYFIQVPPETENECFTNPVSGMPGGYVYILNSTWHPAVHGSSVRSWVLPVRVVAPPAPEIVGTTITWEAVKRIYGSWTALWAANPTWRDVWDQIMDPEDAIAL